MKKISLGSYLITRIQGLQITKPDEFHKVCNNINQKELISSQADNIITQMNWNKATSYMPIIELLENYYKS